MDTEPTPTGADAPRTYAADNWQGLSDDFLSELIAHAESQGTGGHLLVGRGRYIRLLKEIERLRAENAELERLRGLFDGPEKVTVFLVNALRLLNDDELSRLTEQLAARSAWGRAQEAELERLQGDNETDRHLAQENPL